MQATEVQLLFDHLYWMRDQILGAASEGAETFLENEPVTIRDLRTTLVHELDVEWSWRLRLQGSPPESWGPEAELKAANFPDLVSLISAWREDEAEMRGWLERLSDRDVNAPWENEQSPGLPLWYFLLHMYGHAIQQFSDAATLLTRAGYPPGELEFLEFADPRK
ncbi:MAG TPA: DinB family protein [Acidimicrobiia bacterium]|nr:DinB family protein [Acidimicrobiia bacterium]